MGVAMMETLGRETAGKLFDQLNQQAQAQVRDFIQTGVYSRPKADVMLKAAEKIKTTIFFASSIEQSESAKKVVKALVSLDQIKLPMLIERTADDALPRLMAYFGENHCKLDLHLEKG